ncbi:hypothetical protein [Corynebacterium oculi]|uniref:Uncharacterized protein n=1 Tax=Corynebacterium oculi TaxID=1544416 RepID=A0A0Q0YNM0_9CORY|nr:hypothetical protein [Corynebacterium oculi]KQB84040.1 hypothetical protein Cocul_00836 [Corynebacterium oculi]
MRFSSRIGTAGLAAMLALGTATIPAHAAPGDVVKQAAEHRTEKTAKASPASDVLTFIERLVPLTSRAVTFF